MLLAILVTLRTNNLCSQRLFELVFLTKQSCCLLFGLIDFRACLNFTRAAAAFARFAAATANCHYRNLISPFCLNIKPLCLKKMDLSEPRTGNFRLQKQNLNKLLAVNKLFEWRLKDTSYQINLSCSSKKWYPPKPLPITLIYESLLYLLPDQVWPRYNMVTRPGSRFLLPVYFERQHNRQALRPVF